MSVPRGVQDRTSGTYWLVIGGIVLAIAVVVLAALASREPATAWTAVGIDVLLLVVMLVARFAVKPVLARQWTLAICVLAGSVVSLGALSLIVLEQR
jgi:isoprenylcysteine carboxyl methyltransferase (ICMT) family protein YpbQ